MQLQSAKDHFVIILVNIASIVTLVSGMLGASIASANAITGSRDNDRLEKLSLALAGLGILLAGIMLLMMT